jgi:hypothetical protein
MLQRLNVSARSHCGQKNHSIKTAYAVPFNEHDRVRPHSSSLCPLPLMLFCVLGCGRASNRRVSRIVPPHTRVCGVCAVDTVEDLRRQLVTLKEAFRQYREVAEPALLGATEREVLEGYVLASAHTHSHTGRTYARLFCESCLHDGQCMPMQKDNCLAGLCVSLLYDVLLMDGSRVPAVRSVLIKTHTTCYHPVQKLGCRWGGRGQSRKRRWRC